MAPKILIFSLAFHPQVGGAEVAIKEITDRIKDIEFCLITLRFRPEDAPQEHVGNIEVYRVGSGRGSYLSKILYIPRAALLAVRLHKRAHFDAVWAMMSYMLFPLMLIRAFGGARIPYVLTLQEGDPFRHMFGRLHILPFHFLLSRGFKRAQVVQTISNYLAGWARQMGYAGTIEVIPNGVDGTHFLGPPWAHDGVVLITTSRLVCKNANDTVIHALVLLPYSVRFRILGTGPEENSLRKLAEEYAVADRVEFLGYISHDALPAHLHSADIFIRPSRSEGMGNSFIEAMAAGLPVIATQEGGIADFLFDEKRNPGMPPTGFAVDKNSPEQIAEAVKNILGNPERVKRVVENARRLVAEKYNWDLIAKDMREKVFGKVL